MRFQGLVFLVVLALADSVAGQEGPLPDQSFLPPSPRKLDAEGAEPTPLPPSPSTGEPRTSTNMEAELQQFRMELREFQALREEVSRNTRSTDTVAENISTHQRQELMDMLAKLAKKSMTRKLAVPQSQFGTTEQMAQPSLPPTLNVESSDPTASSDVTDPFALGKVLFRQGDFAGAEKAFRRTAMNSENEMTLKYLLATCLRRQSRWQPAMDVYKVVAESNQDPVLRDLAKWQLDNIRWHLQSEAQLEQMRQQREKRMAPGGPSTNPVNSK